MVRVKGTSYACIISSISRLWQASALYTQNGMVSKVLEGIAERSGYYKSAIVLKIVAQGQLLPICAMKVAVVPATFGLYLLVYSCSTELGREQKEYWDTSTFSLRMLHTLPFADKEGVQILEELQDLYPQLFSFFAESCSARRTYLQNVGILGQSLL